MRKFGLVRCLLLVMLGVIAGSCRSASPDAPTGPSLRRHIASRAALGTTFRVTLYAPDDRTAAAAMSAAFERLAEVDRALNADRPDGDVAALNASPERQPVRVGDDLFEVLRHAQRLAADTRGAFDVSRGPYLELWRRAADAGRTPTDAEVEDARLRVGWEKLRLDSIERTATLTVPRMRLDLAGIARGYAADQVMQQLRLHGCDVSSVEAGDVRFVGAPPPGGQWKVPLRGAGGPGTPASMPLDRAAVAYAGAARRDRAGVVINPMTGRPVNPAAPVVVVARSAAAAESVAAAAEVLGPDGVNTLTRAVPTARVRFGPVRSGRGGTAGKPAR